MNNVVFVSFMVLTISISHIGVSGQYIQYNTNAKKVQSVADRQIDTAIAAQVEYEYYDDVIEEQSTAQPTTTSTSTTTTPKPITSYRFLTTHRNGFRPINLNNNKKKFEQTTKQYQPDSYTEASNESAFVQKSQNPNQSKLLPAPPQLRNAIAEVNRRAIGKDYVQEKSAPTSNELNGNGNANFSKRYARFRFKLRSG